MRTSRSVAPRRARPVLRQPAYVAPRYHSKARGRLVFALLILAVCGIVGVGGGLYWSLHHAQSSSSKRVLIHVGPGDSVSSLADQLQRQGLISNALLFRVDAKLRNLAAKLKVGDYYLRRNMSIDDMVGAFAVYSSRYLRVTIPEGFRLEQIAARLRSHGINGAEFLREARQPDPTVARTFSILRDKPTSASLEGYLFPDTYEIIPNSSARDVVRQMLQRLDQRFTPAMRAQARREGWSVYQVITLAAVVEREARAPEDRTKIASVYVNRLTDKTQTWKLDADPTVQYLLGTKKNWWPVLRTDSPATIEPGSPYNTYTHAGLPPGPIANPGLASIHAVVRPAPTNFYYFVAKSDCKHSAFAQTYQEQQANQQKYHCNA